jgi:ketosteroid isomerase-like protein
MSEDMLEAVHGLFAAFSAGGQEAARAVQYLDPEVDLQDHPWVDNAWHHGHEGAGEWAAKLWSIWKNPAAEVSDAIVIDDARILVRYDARGVGKLSGVPVTDTGWAIFTFRDEKILRAASFRSEEEALEAAGLSE